MYRNTAMGESDTWSDVSGSTAGMGRRRSSWTNLIESDASSRVNYNPTPHHKVKNAPPPSLQYMGDAPSRTSSQSAYVTETHQYRVSPSFFPVESGRPETRKIHPITQKGSLPILTDTGVLPAGSLVTGSKQSSAAPSLLDVSTAPNPLPRKATASSSRGVPRPKRNRLQEIIQWFRQPWHVFCILLLVVLLIAAVLITIFVLVHFLGVPSSATFTWNAPEAVRGGQNATNTIQMKVNGNQMRLALQGVVPFRGNYINYYDFKSNRVAIVDEALKSNGKNLACFVMDLDRSNLKDMKTMQKAAANSINRHFMTTGWQPSWSYVPSPMTNTGQVLFDPPIPECNNTRWIQLQYTATNQTNMKCTDCYDFCLPDYGIENDTTKKENYLNIKQRDCFYLFVPEWRMYAQANTMEQNQQDFESYYRNRNHLNVYGNSQPSTETKWINLQGVPQQIMNTTGNLANHALGYVSNTAQQLQHNIFGNTGQQQQMPSNNQNVHQMPNPQNQNQMQPNVPNPNNQLSFSNVNIGYPTAQNGAPNQNSPGYQVQNVAPMNPNLHLNPNVNPNIVNLQGSNANQPNSMYNTNAYGQPAATGPQTFHQQGIVGQANSPDNSAPPASAAIVTHGFGALPKYTSSGEVDYGSVQAAYSAAQQTQQQALRNANQPFANPNSAVHGNVAQPNVNQNQQQPQHQIPGPGTQLYFGNNNNNPAQTGQMPSHTQNVPQSGNNLGPSAQLYFGPNPNQQPHDMAQQRPQQLGPNAQLFTGNTNQMQPNYNQQQQQFQPNVNAQNVNSGSAQGQMGVVGMSVPTDQQQQQQVNPNRWIVTPR